VGSSERAPIPFEAGEGLRLCALLSSFSLCVRVVVLWRAQSTRAPKPVVLSAALATFCGTDRCTRAEVLAFCVWPPVLTTSGVCESHLQPVSTAFQVTRKIWDYIKEKNLQDPKDKRKILIETDEKLKVRSVSDRQSVLASHLHSQSVLTRLLLLFVLSRPCSPE
jgi:hypothetical protein